MTINFNPGSAPSPGVPPGVSGAQSSAPTTATTGVEVDSTAAAKLHDAVRNLIKGNNPSNTLEAPDDVSRESAARAATSLNSLGMDQVNTDIYSFMALFQTMAQSMRNVAREQRTSELQSQVTALQGAAAEMRNAANMRLVATIIQGSSQILAGMATMGMSGASMKSTVQGARLEARGMVMESKIATAAGTDFNNRAQGIGQVIGGAGNILASPFTRAADEFDARKSEKETESKVHETAVQHANDMMQQMMEIIRDVRDKLQSIQQASVETNRGIARNI